MLKIGCSQVDFIDLEFLQTFDCTEYNLIYVCGVNTFRLLKHAKKVGLEKSLRQFLNQGGIYIGVSAGSVILGPSIAIADWFTDDNKAIGLTDFTTLNIVPHTILPHYSEESENKIKDFEVKCNTNVTRLSDDQALVMEGNGSCFILE